MISYQNDGKYSTANSRKAGAPEDEYDPEVRELVKWRKAVTAEQVGAVFLRWFGESGVMPSDMAARIADGINQAHAQHLPS